MSCFACSDSGLEVKPLSLVSALERNAPVRPMPISARMPHTASTRRGCAVAYSARRRGPNPARLLTGGCLGDVEMLMVLLRLLLARRGTPVSVCPQPVGAAATGQRAACRPTLPGSARHRQSVSRVRGSNADAEGAVLRGGQAQPSGAAASDLTVARATSSSAVKSGYRRPAIFIGPPP